MYIKRYVCTMLSGEVASYSSQQNFDPLILRKMKLLVMPAFYVAVKLKTCREIKGEKPTIFP